MSGFEFNGLYLKLVAINLLYPKLPLQRIEIIDIVSHGHTGCYGSGILVRGNTLDGRSLS